MTTDPARARRELVVSGVVQGVGFRPFVHRLATEAELDGEVRNELGVVHIDVQGPVEKLHWFERHLMTDAPPLARIDKVSATDVIDLREGSGFSIEASDLGDAGGEPAIAPDVAVCDACLAELFDPTDRRYRHPFITCTDCGPRFTIVTRLPYDRPNTTMAAFDLCPSCAAEYRNPSDRRHHAQPLACLDCGPTIAYERGDLAVSGTDLVLEQAVTDLAAGKVVAIKGIGGYHLAVDATDGDAVARLRVRKARPDKPFAVMVPDVAAARVLAQVSDSEAEVLTSPARPVVLLRARTDTPLAPEVAPGNPLIGVMLPSAPLHHLVFDSLPTRVLVMTSGNLAGEPIAHVDADARQRLGAIADSFVTHDRTIHMPCDDSVVRVLDDAVLPIRRSRGYAPVPMRVPVANLTHTAVGAEIKNTFAIGRGDTVWLSQHIGDMANRETLDAFETTLDVFSGLHHTASTATVVDAHPDYRTHRWAREHASRVVTVQHHHAHLAALLAEHEVAVGEDVVGFVFDGTGYGADGTIWGGEILVGGYAAVERWGHLVPVSLPGGDSAAGHPCRSALAHLRAAGVKAVDHLASVRAMDDDELRVIERQLETGVNCVSTSSMGRLFDGVASLLDLRHRISYEAQAAIELEILAADTDEAVPLSLPEGEGAAMDAGPLVRDVVAHLDAGAAPAAIARGFHEAVVDAMVRCAEAVRAERGVATVGLTGGVFQNVLLTRLATAALDESGFEVLIHRVVPPNDGGLALGQLMVAAAREASEEETAPCA